MFSKLNITNLEAILKTQRKLDLQNPELDFEDIKNLSEEYTVILEKYKSYPNKKKFGAYLIDEVTKTAEMIGTRDTQKSKSKTTTNTKPYLWNMWRAYGHIRTEFGL